MYQECPFKTFYDLYAILIVSKSSTHAHEGVQHGVAYQVGDVIVSVGGRSILSATAAQVPYLSGSEAGSYVRLIDFVYHSTLGLRVIKKKKKKARNV